MTGHRNQIIGDAGEGLFQYLASYLWNARSLPHPQGEATDTYIYWPDLPEAGRLVVQVKAVERVTPSNSFVRIRPSAARSSLHLRPLAVLCELSTGRAWWQDTNDESFRFPHSVELRIPIDRSRPVNETTRREIRRLTFKRNHRLRLASRSPLPPNLRSVNFDSVMGLIEEAEQERTDDVIRRDGVALALARIVYATCQRLTAAQAVAIIERLLRRVAAKRPGGRSHTLGALVAILYKHPLLDSPEVGRELEQVARFAVGAGDFIHAEFALLIAARAAEMRDKPDVEHLRDLISVASSKSRTKRFERVATKLGPWHPGQHPARMIFRSSTLIPSVIRRSDESLGILECKDEANRAVVRILTHGAAAASAVELRLVDQLTRLRADEILWDELGRSTH